MKTILSLLNRIFLVNKNINKNFSYGKFILENPKATKKERQEAVKKFYDSTR